MHESQDLGTILAADLLQLAVVFVAVTLFAYVRAACGRQARFVVHLALAYTGVGAFYIVDMAISAFHSISTRTMPESMTVVIGSTISLLNTAFFFTTWYLMRDLRLDRAAHENEPLPTMSKPFAAGVIAALMGGISGYIAMAKNLADSPALRTLFVGVDAFLSTCALLCIATELAQMRSIRDPEEGSLFSLKGSHLSFRILTASLFILWGVAQWGRVIWIASRGEWSIVAPYTGQWHQWSAMLKILCAGSTSILAIHALPSVTWRHNADAHRHQHP